jgi:SHOCT-like domain
MNTLLFDAAGGMTFHLARADGDVGIKGWDRQAFEIVLDGDPDQCTAQQEGSVLTVESRVALSVSVPGGATVNVEQVSGDLVLRDLSGPVSVVNTHGEMLIRSCSAPVSLQTVHSDIIVDQLSGPLTVLEVHGDARLNQVNAALVLGTVRGDVRAGMIGGVLEMGAVGGDVRVRDATGFVSLEEGHSDFKGSDLRAGMNIRRVRGDISLKTAVTPGCTYRGCADGDVIARFPEETSAMFSLQAKGTMLAKLPQVSEEGNGQLVGQSGDGAAEVDLAAGGSMSLKIRGRGERATFGVDMGADIAAQIEAQIAESLGSIDVDALAHREIEKAMRKAQKEIEKAQQRAHRGRARAEERVQRAQDRAQRAARRAQEKISRSHRRGGMFGGPSAFYTAGRAAPKSQASDEEQLAILKMVQEGKITVEDAERLLRALDK